MEIAPQIVGLLGFGLMIVLIVSGVPIAFAMLAVAAGGLFIVGGPLHAETQLSLTFAEQGSNFILIAIPLYMLMGQIVYRTDIARDLYDCVYKWLGRLPGGLAITSVVACAGFGSISGGSVTAVATMGPMCMPAMRRYGYDDSLAAGSIASAGTLGILIPPSIVLVVYGVWTETSIGALFIAGIVPGILMTLAYAGTIYGRCLRTPTLGPIGEAFSWGEKVRSLVKLLPVLGTFLIVIGGIYMGVFTPTEAAAFGVFSLFLIAFVMRRMSWKILGTTLRETMHLTGMIFVIIIGGHMMGKFVVLTELTSGVVDWITGLGLPGLGVMLMLSLLFILLGMVLDIWGMLILTIPFTFPVILELGYDPVWFGIYTIIMSELALITPPVGINVFVMAKVAPDVSLNVIFKGVAPFFIATLILVIILTVFPEIVLWLPHSAGMS
jgi:tripartite ATP-independent transporter DctM subunit